MNANKTQVLILFLGITIICYSFISYQNLEGFNNAQKIELLPEMIINETALGDPTLLIDEQDLIKDVNPDSGKRPETVWTIPWNMKDYFPISCIIDLGKTYDLSALYVYDSNGKGKIEVSAGTPFDWNLQITDSLSKYNAWNQHDLNVKTRYIQIKIHSNISTPEIALFGLPIAGQNIAKKKQTKIQDTRVKPTMDQLIGVNAFIDDPLDKLEVAGLVREYHSWAWDEGGNKQYEGYPDNRNAFNPSYGGGGSWFFDKYYTSLRKSNIEIVPCIQGSVDWIPGKRDEKPIFPSADPLDPSSYIAHADHMFQIAARYGKTKVDKSLLKLRADQQKLSGLNLIQYYENWNEPNNDWSGRAVHFTPYEFAAMSSADYDGHKGALGTNVGLKNADPSSKLVMGGLPRLNLDYIKSLKFWADWNRNGSFPFDVINIHHYSNDRGSQRSLGKVGFSPEADSLSVKLKEFVEYRNFALPDKEVWYTEFGYDTHPDSPQKAPQIGSMSQEEVQAIWLLRVFLVIAESGIDRAAMYMLRDVDENNSTQFSTSGLTKGKNKNHEPKISWYYLFTLKKQLAEMVFDKEILKTPSVYIFRFKHIAKEEFAYVIWAPTSEDKEVKGYQITFDKNYNPEAQLINFANKTINGSSRLLEIKNNSITLDVSETPQIIKVNL